MSSESVQPEVEPRTIRAATEHMTVIEEAPAMTMSWICSRHEDSTLRQRR